MSRHHLTLPPIVYTPEPPKPKKARRAGLIGYASDIENEDEAAEIDGPGTPAPVRKRAVLHLSNPVEALNPRKSSKNGRLSTETMTALLTAQEEGTQGGGDTLARST